MRTLSARSTLFIALLCATVLPLLCSTAAAKPATHPNVLLLFSDDHLHTALGCADDPVVQTPNLDRLAKEGVRFTHAFVPNPICTPARAALFTGQGNFTNNVYYFSRPIRETSPLWPRLLAGEGYETFFTGKWHNDGRPEERGFTHGDNIWIGGKFNHANLEVVHYGQPKKDRKPSGKFASTAFADAAIEFLNSRSGEKPFAMMVSFTAPHDPWTPPGKYAQMYRDANMPVPVNFRAKPPFRFNEKFPVLRDQSQLPFPRTKADVRRGLTQYYGMITQMDTQIGRILDALEKHQLAENTLVIFVGDHGYSMGSHGFVGKQTMYEEGIRMPLILRYPRLRRGTATCDSLVSMIDLFPTMFEAAGAKLPKSVEGQSLLGLYQGQEKELRNEIFAAFHSPTAHRMVTRCVRNRRYKLIQHLLTGEVELFDLLKDSHEMTNLAGKPEHAEVQSALHTQLMAWRSRVEKHVDAVDRVEEKF